MSEEIKKLTYKRGQLKGAVTRFSNFLKTLTENLPSTFDDRVADFQQVLQEFNLVQSEIYQLNPAAGHDAEERVEFENNYYEVLGRAKDLKYAKKSSASINNGSITADNNFKLPKISLPSFSGRFDEWTSFKASFESMVHNNSNLNVMQKYHYLRSSLDGEAAEVIRGMNVDDASYNEAWQTIIDRFDNKKKIVYSHVRAILQLPQVRKDSIEGLRSLIDNMSKHLRSLTTLKVPVDKWDVILILILETKLDLKIMQQFNLTTDKNSLPTNKQLLDFLAQRCDSFESQNSLNNVNIKHNKSKTHLSLNSHFTQQNAKTCVCCKKVGHTIQNCQQFKHLSVEERIYKIQSSGHCINCLRAANHSLDKCFGPKCSECKQRHHLLLHVAKNNIQCEPDKTVTIGHFKNQVQEMVLVTAVVNASNNGKIENARALLDCGSQANFITHELADRLNLKVKSTTIKINGVSETSTNVNFKTIVDLESQHDSFKTSIECLVVDQLTSNLPNRSFDKECLNLPKGLKLADSKFNVSRPIDLLIGASTFWDILGERKIKTANKNIICQDTRLGWIIGGSIPSNCPSDRKNNFLNRENNLDFDLTKFWELETINRNNSWSPEERKCEQHFVENFSRSDGRFVVKLPFKNDSSQLSDSKHMARKRFFSLESKLNKNPELKNDYSKFMSEYEHLGHMKLLPTTTNISNDNYYLPHHAVFKADSITTKLRVVFDASANSSSGVSLNDLLMKGPILQDDLFSILARFRTYEFVLSADIKKMYRQVNVAQDDTCFQQVLWRSNSTETLKTYQLQTVTYGTKPASFLAIRCLHQLANEEANNFSLAPEIVKRDFYVDDLLTGANSKEELIQARDEIIQLLKKGKFELDKWNSNESSILENIPSTKPENVIFLDKNPCSKTLGLIWSPRNDTLQYSIPEFDYKQVTKRTILSHISKFFDPLGLINPIIVTAKIFIQHLWQLKLEWDEIVKEPIFKHWNRFASQLSNLKALTIKRNVCSADSNSFELHCFADASEKAYGACVYIRYINNEGISCNLVCAKSRVAPLKTISIPRLELCAALLVTDLAKRVKESLNINIINTYYYTDSKIVLAWFNVPTVNLKTFVANRVAEICEFTSPSQWSHVTSKENPADIISRGLMPIELLKNSLWWHGPNWLRENKEAPLYDKYNISLSDLPETKQSVNLNVMMNINPNLNLIDKFSSFSKLLRVIAFCLRFGYNCKKQNLKRTGPISTFEWSDAINHIVKYQQQISFSQDIECLKKNSHVHNKSKLKALNPFLDKNGILRVGGRLCNSNYEFNYKHQMLLPEKGNLTEIIVRYFHIKHLHCGIQATLGQTRSMYWILGGTNAIKRVIRKCITCFKTKPTNFQPFMGNLPVERVTLTRPFYNCGIDFCGPVHLKQGLRKGATIKAYIAVFVCFATKAMHLELVCNLSTDAFIAALRRFFARRGKSANIYTDNATNFVGAARQLQECHNFFKSQNNKELLINTFAQENTAWHFIPPRAPHFGGLWEAAVKIVKGHITKVIGETKLNYEEFNTLLAQIESIANSRPLFPQSNDPNDFTFLTPGHFLIGTSLTDLPEADLLCLNPGRLSKWQHVQQIKQHFWKRWQRDYLHHLQTRTKWQSPSQEPRVGQLVLIREEGVPPMCWRSGRIVELHSGVDAVTRVVTIRTPGGTYKRALNRLCALPIDDPLTEDNET